jgi:Cys-tRNA(Pro)/Cys-tRNA(Cys) deacylase
VQTPATVFLEAQGIDYQPRPYDHDPGADSFGLEAANKLRLDPDVVFKTLMARLEDDQGELVVAIVPVTHQLDLKALARAAGAKRARMAVVAHAERSSGYVAGGISPFGQKRRLRTFIDESAEICETIYVSGGQRGLDIGLSPTDLIEALNVTVAPLVSG